MDRILESVEHQDRELWCEVHIGESHDALVRFGVRAEGQPESVAITGSMLTVLRTLEEAAQRLRMLIGGPECSDCVADRTVVVQVTGGGAYLARKPAGVSVAIVDFDAPLPGESLRLYGDDISVCNGVASPVFTDVPRDRVAAWVLA